MPSIVEISYRSRMHGPISSGKIHEDVANYENDVAEELAEEGESIVLHNLATSIRHHTPYYETRIDTRQLAPNRYQVHDHGVVYGPWLEGTGSRNSPVTIFPGYWSFSRAEEELRGKRRGIARRILRGYRSRGLLI